ncbi:ABC transporter permease [Epibacterium sp. Ofav1-8]|jgi:putative ABC transport system permease protein|uniref:ABC transporter permease n=1 Tax=Epibacterium sp. Ofav1-8 TaxID=2917735 RepID=UPI001EF4FA8C|nr:ABC transporter permease [Epibacterium sp. Ofav1-8]MCG7622233.1 FtsX-like permease family protein [Epibacterium sp. Ofav1-8]
MFGFLRQSLALSTANLRSLPRRAWISLSMVLSVTLVVLVLLGFLAMANGFRKTLSSTGADNVALVLSRGAFSEALSRIETQQAHLVEEAPGLVRTDDGTPLISRELVVPVDAVALDSNKNETLSLRGIDQTGLTLRPRVQISDGRMMTPGTAEIVVGARLASRYRNLAVGDTITFGRSQWTVVGHFTAGGSVFESELLADAGLVQAQFNRPNQIQSLRVQLSDAARFEQFRAYVEDELDMGLAAQTEKAFYAAQASDISRIILFLGWPLAIVMAFGAAVGAMTTMYSSVSDRMIEIATVRALGFSRSAAFVATLVEALVLTLIGCAIGVALAWIGLDGWSASTKGGANAQLAFQLALSWPQAVSAVVLALAIGAVGGGLPALRATRVPLRAAMTGRA